MNQRLENPLSPSTFRAALATLGLRYEQVSDDLEVGLKTVEGWTKKSFPSARAREYVQTWLDRVDADITQIANDAEQRIENGEPYIVLVTAWSGAGLKTLDPTYHDYPATVHMAMIGRAFAELNARNIPARVEYAERQHLQTLQREPEPHFHVPSTPDNKA